MKIGYARISRDDGSQKHDLQIDDILNAGVATDNIYTDKISGSKKDRPGLAACLKALRTGDTLVVWSLDRLGRNLRHLVNLVNDLSEKGISINILTGQMAEVDTSTAQGRLIFQIFSALAEFELELTRERIRAGIKAARARGRMGGRKPKMTKAKIRLAMASMGKKNTVVMDLAKEIGVTRATLYQYVSPDGSLRPAGEKVLSK